MRTAIAHPIHTCTMPSDTELAEMRQIINALPPADSADLRKTSNHEGLSLRTSCGLVADLGADLDFSPEPLPQRIKNPPYPVTALGGWLADAAEAIAHHVQLPLAVAAQSVLAVASLAAQGHINVRRGNISGYDPVSLYLISILESGDRKSAADKLALKPVRDIEAKRREEYQAKRKEHEALMTAWEMRKKTIEDSFKPPKGEQMSVEDARELARQLTEHDGLRPVALNDPSMTLSEPTAEGMFFHLKNCSMSSGLFNDEGIGFFDGHGMTAESRGRTIAAICKLWDSGSTEKARAAGKEYALNRRLSAHLMMQPIVAAKVLNDPLLREQGFLPRFLVVAEPSIAGTRFLSCRPDEEGAYNDPRIIRYLKNMEALLNKPLQGDREQGLVLMNMDITGPAYSVWRGLHDSIEEHLKPDGRYALIRGFASKSAEHAARMAAILAWIEGCPNPQEQHIERAGELIEYYLEALLAQTENATHDQTELNAHELLVWIREHGGKIASADFKKLPARYRSAKAAREALKPLETEGYIQVTGWGRNGKSNAWQLVEGVCYG